MIFHQALKVCVRYCKDTNIEDTFQLLHCPPPVLKVAVHIVGEANYQVVQFQKLLTPYLVKSLVVSPAGHSNANATLCASCNKVKTQKIGKLLTRVNFLCFACSMVPMEYSIPLDTALVLCAENH